MKRYFLALMLAAVVFGVMLAFIPKPLSAYLVERDDATCYVYCRETEMEAQSVGFGYIVACSQQDLTSVIAQCRGVDGVSASFKATETEFWRIVERCEFVDFKQEEFAGLITVCGYVPNLIGGVFLDGAKVNLQLAYSGGTVYVGSPLILGSF